MTQEKFRIGITRDNLKADGDPIFDKALLGRLDDVAPGDVTQVVASLR